MQGGARRRGRVLLLAIIGLAALAAVARKQRRGAEPRGQGGSTAGGSTMVGQQAEGGARPYRAGEESFHDLARRIGTDKVHPSHTYYHAYERYLAPLRHQPIKMMEIGLGCNMGYGPGKSVRVWKEFFTHPQADIWEAEFDAGCVSRWGTGGLLKNPVLVGDQADINVLRNWTLLSGGNFDVIVEDGGHSNLQMVHSFLYLFHNALKPGGIYFMEDLIASHPRMQNNRRFGRFYNDGPETPTSKVLGWVQALLWMEFPSTENATREVGGVESIHCFKGMCAFHKCPAGPGPRCP